MIFILMCISSYMAHSINCTEQLKYASNYFLSDPSVVSFLSNSGKGINDFGFYYDCTNASSNYFMLQISMSSGGIAISFNIGLCMPSLCHSEDFDTLKKPIASTLSKFTGFDVKEENVLFLESKALNDDASSMNIYRWLSIIALTVLLLIAIIGCNFEQSKSNGGYILGCFGIRKNAKALLYSENRVDKNLDMFNGVRVLSMGWVIVGHSLVMALSVPSLNIQDLLKTMTTKMSLGTITAATFAVDVFFCLSGFFACFGLTQLFYNKANRRASIIVISILKRVLRLYPIYLAVFMLYFNIVPLIGNGPIYYQTDTFVANCRTNWFYNLLFINNFEKSTNMCFQWTWYISNDMQFFILLLPVCIIYSIRKIAGVAFTVALILASHIYTFVVCFVNKYPVYDSNFKVITDAYEKIYYPPWSRVSTYLIGVLFCWLYLGFKDQKYKTSITDKLNGVWKNSKVLRYILYIVGFCLITFFTYAYSYFFTHKGIAEIWSVLYYTFSRAMFTLGLMLIIYPVVIGRGKPLLAFMGNSLFNFMAKITYAVYQVHLMIFPWYLLSTLQGMEYSVLYLVTRAVDVFVTSYMLGFVLTLLFESPIVQLEKIMFVPSKKELKSGKDDESPLTKKEQETKTELK